MAHTHTHTHTQKPLSYRSANTDDEDEGGKAPVKRGRSASTGSISERRSATPEEDSSLLIVHKGPPPTKPRPPKKVPVVCTLRTLSTDPLLLRQVPVLPPHPKPKRPAPAKPSRPEAEHDSKHISKDERYECSVLLGLAKVSSTRLPIWISN